MTTSALEIFFCVCWYPQCNVSA